MFIKIKGIEIPQILLGTSPFIAAGQFGARSIKYYYLFYRKPENIAKIIRKSYELGIRGIQLLPYSHVIKALKKVQKELSLTVVGTIGPDEPLKDISILNDLNASAMLLHGELTDTHMIERIGEMLDRIKESGCLNGLVTHRPLYTLKWIQNTNLDFDLIMIPLNKQGFLMDGSPAEVIKEVRKVERTIIAKKVLAAGRLDPLEALKFVLDMDIKIMAIGIASEKEASETFKIAFELLSNNKNKVRDYL